MNIKLVRMQNGDDIISDVTQVGNIVTLTNPLRLIFRRLPTGQTMMLVAPWLPNELIEENHAIVSNTDVLTFFSPKDKLVEYYNKMVEINMQRKENFGKILDDYLQTEIETADLEEEDLEEAEITAEVMEAIEEFKRNKLH
jgi:hypothetical protein